MEGMNPAPPSNSQLLALANLYDAAGGDTWDWKEPYRTYGYPWNITDWQNQNPCLPSAPWQGINCTVVNTDTTVISSLRLEKYGLQGYLPSSIGYLSSMVYLSFASNHLKGNIPKEIGYMTQVEFIAFNDNKFGGKIPTQIGKSICSSENITILRNCF